MRQAIQVLLTFLTVLIFSGAPAALAGGGTSGAEFLRLPVLSRGAALGGSLVATATGTEGLFYNPASLGLGRGREVSLSHNELYQDLRLENASLTLPLSERLALGISATYLGYGEIAGYDPAGNSTGEVTAYSTALTVGASWRLSDQLAVGAAVKPIWESLGEYQARTAAFDLGLHWRQGRLSVGAQAANLGGRLTFVEEQSPLPRSLRAGIAYQTFNGSSTITAALSSEAGGLTVLGGGIEYQYTRSLSMRVGYRSDIAGSTERTASLSLGMGVNLGGIQVDYAYRPSSDLDDSHQITLVFR